MTFELPSDKNKKFFLPSLNSINKRLHEDKFSIYNRLLSIYDDHLFINSIYNIIVTDSNS